MKAPIDSIRSHTLYAEAAAQDAARGAGREAGPSQAGEGGSPVGAALEEGASAVERAQDGSGGLPSPDLLPELDDDELHARLHARAAGAADGGRRGGRGARRGGRRERDRRL